MGQIIRTLKDDELILWDDFISRQHSYPFHLRSYTDALKQKKWTFDYVVWIDDEQSHILSAILIQKRKIPFTPFYVIYLPYAPIGESVHLGNQLIEYVISIYKSRSIKMTLQLQTPHVISQSSFKKTKDHYTFVIDLLETDEKRFENYSKTYRNCIRKAVKENVQVIYETGEEAIHSFLEMYHSMTDRKDIDPIDSDLMKNIMSNLLSGNQAILAKTVFQEKVYNYAFVGVTGQHARYLYGASLPQSSLPPMGQYLHHEIMCQLKKMHVRTYDLGGITALEVIEGDPSYGVYKFKKGFSGIPIKIATEYTFKRVKFI